MRAGRRAGRQPAVSEPATDGDVRHRGGAGRSHRRAGLRDPVAGRAPLPARGLRVHPEHPAAGRRSRPPHPAGQDRLRVQHRPHLAPAPAGRGLRDGRHPDRGPRGLRRGPRVPLARGRDVRQPDAGRRGQPRAVRGAGRDHPQGVPRGIVRAPGRPLHAAARGALPRLRSQGDHAGAAAHAPAGRGVAADRQRQRAQPGLHGPARHQGRDLVHGRERRRALAAGLPGGGGPPRAHARRSART